MRYFPATESRQQIDSLTDFDFVRCNGDKLEVLTKQSPETLHTFQCTDERELTERLCGLFVMLIPNIPTRHNARRYYPIASGHGNIACGTTEKQIYLKYSFSPQGWCEAGAAFLSPRFFMNGFNLKVSLQSVSYTDWQHFADYHYIRAMIAPSRCYRLYDKQGLHLRITTASESMWRLLNHCRRWQFLKDNKPTKRCALPTKTYQYRGKTAAEQ